MTDLMIWSARCDSCGAVMFFGADGDTDSDRAKEIETTWPGSYEDGGFSPDCIACEGPMDWNGNDPIENVLLREALLTGRYTRVHEPSDAGGDS